MDEDIKDVAMAQDIKEEDEFVLPSDANETIYIKNLNEKVKLDVLKKSLESLFSTYGTVLSVTAHGNVRMRGQAFVAFDSKEPAAKAVSEVVGFPLYGKPMQLAFAKTKSDAVVALKDDKDTFETHKAQRKEHKLKQRREYLHQKRLRRRQMEHDGQDAGTTATAAPRRQEMQMPDEYLPPNKILFLHNVPERISRDQLDALFRPHQGLIDVRTIPGRNVAFVEFTDSVTSAIAKDALHGHAFSSTETLRITFAK